jgi:hypothetical protein
MNSLKMLFWGACLAIIGGFLPCHSLHCQTILTPGQIYFTGYNSLPTLSNDNFSFVLLVNVTSGTQISFTDKGWFNDGGGVEGFISNANAPGDGSVTWTAPAAGVACGTEIRIMCEWNTGLAATVGTVVGGVNASSAPNDAGQTSNFIELGGAGDELFAFQGTIATPTLLAGFDGNGGWLATTSATPSSIQSAQPTALGATFAPTLLAEADNYKYNCPTASTSGTRAALFTNLTTGGNWISQNSTDYVLPTGCTWNVTDCVPLAAKRNLVARSINGRVELSWENGNPNQLEHVIVDRSLDAIHFETVEVMAPMGHASMIWYDNSPKAGVSWYRIQEVNLEGEHQVSEAVEVNVMGLQHISCTVSNSGSLQVSCENSLEAGSRLELMNLQGQQLFSCELEPIAFQEVDVPPFKEGVYLCRIRSQATTTVCKLLIHN